MTDEIEQLDGIDWQGLGLGVQALIKSFCGDDSACCSNKAKEWIDNIEKHEALLKNAYDDLKKFVKPQSSSELVATFNSENAEILTSKQLRGV